MIYTASLQEIGMSGPIFKIGFPTTLRLRKQEAKTNIFRKNYGKIYIFNGKSIGITAKNDFTEKMTSVKVRIA